MLEAKRIEYIERKNVHTQNSEPTERNLYVILLLRAWCWLQQANRIVL